jgi:hypothetical protein
VTVTTDSGLNSYEAQRNGKFFDFDFPFQDEDLYPRIYGKYKRYSTRKARDGFSRYVADEVLGPAFTAASTLSLITTITATTLWILLWISFYVAFPRNFWFVSGCSFGYAATCAKLAG